MVKSIHNYPDTMAKKTAITIRFQEVKPMSKHGYKQWTPNMRRKVRKEVYVWLFKGQPCPKIPVERLANRDAIAELVHDFLWDGEFLLYGYTNAKTKMHIKPVKLCRVKHISKGENYQVKMIVNYRLFRYWFWNDKPKSRRRR